MKEIKQLLEKKDYGTKAFFNNNKYQSYGIKQENFISLDNKKETFVFIDGGNQEIISTPNLNLSKIRLAAVCYEGLQKKFSKSMEFYCLTSAIVENTIKYSARVLGNFNMENFQIDAMDETIKDGIHHAKISKVPGIIRRIAELKLASEFQENIVLDGSLQLSYKAEEKYMSILESTSKSLMGFSKTNSLLTEKGWPVSTALINKAPAQKWTYKIGETSQKWHEAKIYFAKLHDKSARSFRIEMNGEDAQIISLICGLAENSRDYTFPGYPYGLIEADKLARISNHEAEIEKIRFRALLKKTSLEELEGNLNAHDVLDRM